MAELNIDLSKLPEDVRDKLAELDLELSEGKNQILFDISLLSVPTLHLTHISINKSAKQISFITFISIHHK